MSTEGPGRCRRTRAFCCGHTEMFETAEAAHDASWDVAPYFTLQPLCDCCMSAPILIHGLDEARRLHADDTPTGRNTDAQRHSANSPGRSRIRTRAEDDLSGNLRRFEGSILDHFRLEKSVQFEARFRGTTQSTSPGARPDSGHRHMGRERPRRRALGPHLRCAGGVAHVPS